MERADVTSATPNNEELVFIYREGLKPQVKTFLAARSTITDLKQLQDVALQIDAALYSSHGSSMINRPTSHRPVVQRGHHSSSNQYNYRPNSSTPHRPFNNGRNNNY